MPVDDMDDHAADTAPLWGWKLERTRRHAARWLEVLKTVTRLPDHSWRFDNGALWPPSNYCKQGQAGLDCRLNSLLRRDCRLSIRGHSSRKGEEVELCQWANRHREELLTLGYRGENFMSKAERKAAETALCQRAFSDLQAESLLLTAYCLLLAALLLTTSGL